MLDIKDTQKKMCRLSPIPWFWPHANDCFESWFPPLLFQGRAVEASEPSFLAEPLTLAWSHDQATSALQGMLTHPRRRPSVARMQPWSETDTESKGMFTVSRSYSFYCIQCNGSLNLNENMVTWPSMLDRQTQAPRAPGLTLLAEGLHLGKCSVSSLEPEQGWS